MQLYDKLLGLPLFQGMSSSDLQGVVSTAKIGFMKYKRNEVVVDAMEPCRRLLFLMDGDMEMKMTSADHSFSVTEQLPAPSLIEPERLFGLTQHYSRCYTTRSLCHLISIGKDDVIRLSSEYMVFRLNLMNILSTQVQRQQRYVWQQTPDSVRGRVVRFLRQHCALPSGKKVFNIKMQQLANETNDARLEVSQVLNEMDAEGSIRLQRGIITINKLETLLISNNN